LWIVYALDAETGNLKWSYTDIPAAQQWIAVRDRMIKEGKDPGTRGLMGLNVPPIMADGVLLVCVGRDSYSGLDGATGRKLWGPIKMGGGFPLRWTHKGKAYFATGSQALEPQTGKVLWKIEGASVKHTAAVCEDYLITGSPVSCYRISPEKATLAWKSEIHRLDDASGCYPCPLIYRNHLYAQVLGLADRPSGDSYKPKLICVSMADGKVLKEWGEGRTGFGYEGVVSDGRLIAGGSGIFYKTDPADFKFLSKEDSPQAGCSALALADGRLFLRMDRHMGCYDLRKSE
jgi:outer membrane protein assembly factor BamB